MLCISFFYEILHYFIPNRVFEFYDLLGNMMGVVVVILRKLFKMIRVFIIFILFFQNASADEVYGNPKIIDGDTVLYQFL